MFLLRRRFRYRPRLRHKTKKLLARVTVLLCLQLFLLTALLVFVFRWADPPITAFMLHTQPESGLVALEYQWVDRDDIALDAFAAVLAARSTFIGSAGTATSAFSPQAVAPATRTGCRRPVMPVPAGRWRTEGFW